MECLASVMLERGHNIFNSKPDPTDIEEMSKPKRTSNWPNPDISIFYLK